MSLKSIRISRLKQLQLDRRITGPAELGKVIGKSTSQASDLLTGRAPFGEKVARSIEEAAELPDGWLDEVDEGSAASRPDAQASGVGVPKHAPSFLPTSARDYRTIVHTLAKTLRDADMKVSIEQFLLMADGLYEQWGDGVAPQQVVKDKASS